MQKMFQRRPPAVRIARSTAPCFQYQLDPSCVVKVGTDHNRGPSAKPSTKKLRPSVATSSLTSNSRMTSRRPVLCQPNICIYRAKRHLPPEYTEEQKETTSVSMATVMTNIHLYRLDHFFGSLASFCVHSTTYGRSCVPSPWNSTCRRSGVRKEWSTKSFQYLEKGVDIVLVASIALHVLDCADFGQDLL